MAEKAEIDAILEQLNQKIKPYQLAYVDPKLDCVFLEKNARFMTKEQIGRLTDNVRNDGFLSQIPLGILRPTGKYEIISGNHRVKAAIRAEIEYILLLFLREEEVTKEKALAIQLSHNAISGQDDMGILAELYSMIGDLDLKAYSGINEFDLNKYVASDLGTINESNLNLKELHFVMTEVKLEQVDEVMKKLEERMIGERQDRIVFANFHKFVKVISETKKKYNMKNDTVAFLKLIEICEEHLKNTEK